VRILVYGLNYPPELTGIGKYTGELNEWLAARSHDVHVVCALPYYPEWRIPDTFKGRIYRSEHRNGVLVSRSWLYVPRHPKTTTRLLHLSCFAVLSIPLLLRQWSWRPEVLIGIEPTLFCAPATLAAFRLFGARSVLHIQDFELDAILGLSMGRASSIGSRIERWLMRRFDAISTISYSMADRATAKLGDDHKVLFFPNWVDVDFVKPGHSGDPYRESWGIPSTSKVILYSGNMGKKQGLETVMEAARRLRSLEDAVFIFVGTGAAVDDLRKEAEASSLSNVRFFPLQPYERLPELMALADVHLVVQRRGTEDAVLPSKLTTILSAGGNALITAESSTELGKLCEKHPGIARRVEPEDPEKLTEALLEMLADIDVDNRRYNPVARAYAEENLDKQRVLARFEADLIKLVGTGNSK
jgi:colanic acid biosynthesis glycosyl transferase WcaI